MPDRTDATASPEGRARRPAVGARLLDPEARLQHARDLAWGALARRDRTVAELRTILAGKRVEPELIAQVVQEVAKQGYLDDERYARVFAEDRRRLDGWGTERIERRLLGLGVAPQTVAAAVGGRSAEAELEAALDLLRRRAPAPARTPLERDRQLRLLLRRGYASELAYDAVRRHARVSVED
jgi:regulatory protein